MKIHIEESAFYYLFCFFFSLVVLFLTGCTPSTTYAPVINAWQDPDAIKSRYRVQEEDTIYSIALAFDLDYRDLARANHLVPPYQVRPGQTLTMQIDKRTGLLADQQPPIEPCSLTLPEFTFAISPPLPIIDRPVVTKNENLSSEVLPLKTVGSNQARIVTQMNSGRWQWPVKGIIRKPFSLEKGSKGIDIAGHFGDSVRAAAAGKVVYSGSGLRGYGNLVIIKHSDNYLSAYAYNQRLLVKEGDVVKAGAVIAKMGQNNIGEVVLHFEIRCNGKPVNPLLYL